MTHALLGLLILTVPLSSQTPRDLQSVLDRAIVDFETGRIEASVRGFDEVVRRSPDIAPYLWQRGIALYYTGRYEDCRAQFESHRTVNPSDVENAAWHFLCVAGAESADNARAALLPVGSDRRVPMREIYEMFRGDRSPEDVLRAGGEAVQSRFYAHLYVGLYLDAVGDEQRALEHIRTAAEERFSGTGYMHTVAQVHAAFLEGPD